MHAKPMRIRCQHLSGNVVTCSKIKPAGIVAKFRFGSVAGHADPVQVVPEPFALLASSGAEMISFRHWFASGAVEAPNTLSLSKYEGLGRAFRRLGWIGFWVQIGFGLIPVILGVYALIFNRNPGSVAVPPGSPRPARAEARSSRDRRARSADRERQECQEVPCVRSVPTRHRCPW